MSPARTAAAAPWHVPGVAPDGLPAPFVGQRRWRSGYRHRRRRRGDRRSGRPRPGRLGRQQVGHPGSAARPRRGRPSDRDPHPPSRRRRLLLGPAEGPLRSRRSADAATRPRRLIAAVVVRRHLRSGRGLPVPPCRAAPGLLRPRRRAAGRRPQQHDRRSRRPSPPATGDGMGPRHRRQPRPLGGHPTTVRGRRAVDGRHVTAAPAPGHGPGGARARCAPPGPPPGLVCSVAPGRARPGRKAQR